MEKNHLYICYLKDSLNKTHKLSDIELISKKPGYYAWATVMASNYTEAKIFYAKIFGAVEVSVVIEAVIKTRSDLAAFKESASRRNLPINAILSNQIRKDKMSNPYLYIPSVFDVETYDEDIFNILDDKKCTIGWFCGDKYDKEEIPKIRDLVEKRYIASGYTLIPIMRKSQFYTEKDVGDYLSSIKGNYLIGVISDNIGIKELSEIVKVKDMLSRLYVYEDNKLQIPMRDKTGIHIITPNEIVIPILDFESVIRRIKEGALNDHNRNQAEVNTANT